jgi:hypothetical protein
MDNSWYRALCRPLVAGALILPGLMAARTAAGVEPACEQGWLLVQAQVANVSPAGARAERLTPNRKRRLVHAGDLLCNGDTLIVPKDASVELNVAGRAVLVGGAKPSYVVEGGAASGRAAISEYLRLALATIESLPPPEKRPQSTQGRGAGGPGAGGGLPIKPILYLDELPRQRLTPDLPVVVAWRNGAAPFSCETSDANANVIWKSPPSAALSCQVGTRAGSAARLVVRDAGQRSEGWNLARAQWSAVPRPDWIGAAGGLRMPSGELGAWAIWLWQNGGEEWRLQALGMLNAAARNEWLASYFLDQALAEVPPLLPK